MCDSVDAEFVLFRENSCCTCVHNIVLYNDLKKDCDLTVAAAVGSVL